MYNFTCDSLVMYNFTCECVCVIHNLIYVDIILYLAFRFGFEQSSYSVIESDEVVSVCVTADRGDGSEMYTLSLTSINVTSQGIQWFTR